MTTRKQAYKLFNRHLKNKTSMVGGASLATLTYNLVRSKKIGWKTYDMINDAARRADILYDSFTEQVRVKVARELR